MKKKIVLFSLIFLCAVILLCLVIFVPRVVKISKMNFSKDKFIYNGYSSEWVFTDAKYAYFRDSDAKIIDLKTNEEFSFDLDIESETNKEPVYSDGENIYFIAKNDYSYGIYYYDKNFNTHCLIDENKLSLNKIKYDIDDFDYQYLHENYLNSPSQFVVAGRYIFLYCPGAVIKYDLLTNTEKKIFDSTTGETSFSYSNGKIYFEDDIYNLYCFDISNDDLYTLNISAYSFCVNNIGILYSDLEDEMKLKFYDFNTGENTAIYDKYVKAYDLDNDYIYFSDNGRYFKSDFSGEKEEIKRGKVASSLKKGTNNRLYISYDSSNGVNTEYIEF